MNLVEVVIEEIVFVPEPLILLPRRTIPTTKSVVVSMVSIPSPSLEPPDTESKITLSCFATVKVSTVPLAEVLVPPANRILKPVGPSGKLSMRREVELGDELSV
jgi:hypothetical protein